MEFKPTLYQDHEENSRGNENNESVLEYASKYILELNERIYDIRIFRAELNEAPNGVPNAYLSGTVFITGGIL